MPVSKPLTLFSGIKICLGNVPLQLRCAFFFHTLKMDLKHLSHVFFFLKVLFIYVKGWVAERERKKRETSKKRERKGERGLAGTPSPAASQSHWQETGGEMELDLQGHSELPFRCPKWWLTCVTTSAPMSSSVILGATYSFSLLSMIFKTMPNFHNPVRLVISARTRCWWRRRSDPVRGACGSGRAVDELAVVVFHWFGPAKSSVFLHSHWHHPMAGLLQ